MLGFYETVQAAWAQPVNTQDPILRMHVKLIRTAKALKMWRRQSLGNLPLRLEIAKRLLLMDVEQEQRPLSQDELVFRRYLKAKTVDLAALIRSRARQHSRLTWIRNGDACTKFFMLHASNRRRKLFILSLKVDTGLATTQQHKQEVVFNHFVSLLGRTQTRLVALNWSHLGYERQDLNNLEDLFEEDEIKKVIIQLPNEKAPSPNGFIGLFYKKCWPIIRVDLLEALRAFHSLRTQRLDLINETNVVLLPKEPDAATITEFRPISLINSLAKIITKVLADRLAPRLNDLVSTCQNAFIKKRCIHDNFLYGTERHQSFT
jgi:hypothetical protein